jgi:hypothetical protein
MIGNAVWPLTTKLAYGHHVKDVSNFLRRIGARGSHSTMTFKITKAVLYTSKFQPRTCEAFRADDYCCALLYFIIVPKAQGMEVSRREEEG